jgi:hypothetical protein
MLADRECVPGQCPCQSEYKDDKGQSVCHNTVIYCQRFPRTEVFETIGRGFGLRLLEPISANSIVAEYMGEVIATEEMLRRMKSYKAKDDFYFANLGGGLMLDASSMGSLARFANHSCEPSCMMQRWTVLGEPRIVLVALKDLDEDTEITYCYNFEDDGWVNNPIRAQICLCGSAYCSGKVGKAATGSDAQVKSMTKRIQDYCSGEKKASKELLESVLVEAKQLSSLSQLLEPVVLILQGLIVHVDQWMIGCQKLLSRSNGQLLDIAAIRKMLDQAPKCLRSDLKKRLKQYIMAYDAASSLITRCQSASILSIDPAGASSSSGRDDNLLYGKQAREWIWLNRLQCLEGV